MPSPLPAPSPRSTSPVIAARWPTAIRVAVGALGRAPHRDIDTHGGSSVERISRWIGPPIAAEGSALRAGMRQGPCAVLVHGSPGEARDWAAYLQGPPAGAQVIAVDRPGFGRSGPDAAVVSIEAQARALMAWVPDGEGPVVLVGHSLGGPVVACAAARWRHQHPGRPLAIVLLAPALDPGLERIHPLQRVGAWPAVRAVLPRPIRNANHELLSLRAELEALEPLLHEIEAPVFVVHGTHDNLVPVANAAFLEARLGRARSVTTTLLPGHDHFLPWKAQPAVRTALDAALRASC